jgi:hypothetical protein
MVCQPGIGWREVNETLKEKGIPLFFPVRCGDSWCHSVQDLEPSLPISLTRHPLQH